MTDWTLRDFLVFESSAEPVPAYTCFFTEHLCLGHVRAPDEVAAAKVVAGVTERIGTYVVIPATVVDLAAPDPVGIDLFGEVADTPHR